MLLVACSLFLIFGGMALTFYAVCIVCDDHLVPAIEIFITQFNIPEDVAGVTLIAFGSATPELVLNTIAGANGTADLSLSSLLGSSLIAFGLIPPLCLIMTTQKELELKTWPIAREIIFYLLGLMVFVVLVEDGELTVREAGTSVAIYVIYVLLVVVMFLWFPDKGPAKGDTAATRDKDKEREREGLLSDVEMRESGFTLSENSKSSKQDIGVTARSLELRKSNVGSEGAGTSARGTSTDRDDDEGQGQTASPQSRAKDGSHRESLGFMASFMGNGSSTSTTPTAAAAATKINIALADFEEEDVESIEKIPTGPRQNVMHYITNRALPQAQKLWSTATSPISVVVAMTIPDLGAHGPSDGSSLGQQKKVPFLRAFGALTSSIIWVAILAWCIIGLSETLITFLGVGTSTIGATLVALGSEIPDAVASVALARGGYSDGAMAGAIGSQVINITLGVGLPILVSCWLNGENIKVNKAETRSLWLLTALLLLVIIGYALVTLPLALLRGNGSCKLSKYTHLKRKGAWALLTMLTAAVMVFVFLNEEVLDEITDDDQSTPFGDEQESTMHLTATPTSIPAAVRY